MLSPKTLRVSGLKMFFLALGVVSCFGVMRSQTEAATLYVPSTQYPTIQSAVNAANLGDTIVVEAGRTYTENIVLKPKSTGSGWITIQSSKLHLLPGEGDRVKPSDAVNMPKIQTATGQGATVFSTQSGSNPSHHYKLVGLEISRASSLTGQLSTLIEFGTQGSSQDSLSEVPHHFVIDRCFVHGEDDRNTRRGLSLNAKNVEVIGSYFSKFHEPGADSQAILGWNTPGDIVIRNNYLEAASENVMFGGAEIDLPIVITNILIENNHFFKPLSWKGRNLGVKNLLEFKNGTEIVIRNNIFENVWAEAQTGWAIVMTPRDENEVARVDNITFEYNIVKNAGNGFQMLTDNDYSNTPSLKNININNNLMLLAGSTQGGQGNIVILVPGMNPAARDILFKHNTFVTAGTWEYRSFAMDGQNLVHNLVFDNNIFAASSGTVWGVIGAGHSGTEGLNRSATSWSFSGNVLQRSSSGYPSTSTYVANLGSIGFVNSSTGNYALKTDSPYKGAAPGGKDIGADIAGLNERTACVESGKQSDCVANRVSFSNYDFDGDGRADIAVFRPSDSVWYLNKSSEGFGGLQWGIPTDKIVPADYDGDGKTDVAVFRPESNRWYILKSTTMTYDVVYFGMTGDVPVQADYDGDGKADIALWRPSNGIWYKLNSSDGAFSGYQFGLSTDRPAVGDYDGDGRSDYAVFRPDSGVWYLQKSTEGFAAIQFGLPTDKITPADFNGDGKTEIAVFRPSNGVWYQLETGSTSRFSAIQFGLSSDVPSPADFDGDGKADLAVFRPSTGVWYLQKSSEGFNAMTFGMNGDVPISSAFAR